MKRALITGVGGQDGSYLAEYLLSLGYEVFGTTRGEGTSYPNLIELLENADCPNLHIVRMDLRNALDIDKVIRESNPDEIYNLGGQTFVPTSWHYPSETFDVNVSGLNRILQVVQNTNPKIKVYQASSSEMFGNHGFELGDFFKGLTYDEKAPMYPVSPYAVSKVAAHKLARCYRDYGLFVACGILFNHESPRRGLQMVTRKITRHVARWFAGYGDILRLGNPEARRDWGFAGDYVKMMHAMLQREIPDDYVIATGEPHSVKEFLWAAIVEAGLNVPDYERLVEWQHSSDVRKNELHYLSGDSSKAQRELSWKVETRFPQLVQMMVSADIHRLNSSLRKGGAVA